MAKPTILIVGGAWHTADYLLPLAKIFSDASYPTKTLGLPSVGASPPATDFTGDVAAVRDAAIKLISEGKDVIAILHSLGGIAGIEALLDLERTSTEKAGVNHVQALGDKEWKPARQKFTKNELLTLPLDFASWMLYNDLEKSQAEHWTSLLKPQSVGIYDSPLTHETYKEIPSGYLLTTLDRAFIHDYQKQTVELAGFPAERMEKLATGHIPWLTKPEEVRDFVLKIAREADLERGGI